ncbi:hypothetical protein D3C76_27910 [compost metagenome]
MVMVERFIIAFLLACLFIGSYGVTYKYGDVIGSRRVSAEWASDTEKRNKAINELQGKYNVLQDQHKAKVEELTRDLQKSADEHQVTLDGYRTDYDQRLQLATSRADVYQRKARGSASERDALAEHAAQLDRSLEEGRKLVREFGETVRQRDRTISALKQMVLIDRTLLTESSEPNGR